MKRMTKEYPLNGYSISPLAKRKKTPVETTVKTVCSHVIQKHLDRLVGVHPVAVGVGVVVGVDQKIVPHRRHHRGVVEGMRMDMLVFHKVAT